jgi:hypothetical protein
LELTGVDIDIAVDDDVCLTIVTTGTGSITLEIASVEWVSTNKKFHSIFANTSTGHSIDFGETMYIPLGGGSIEGTSTVGHVASPVSFPMTLSKFALYVTSNTIADPPNVVTSTFRVQKAAANGNENVSVSGSPLQVGRFEDASNTDVFTALQDGNYSALGGGTIGTITLASIGVLIENTEPTSAIKTINGLARASVKAVNGLALASVKTWNGLA